MQKVTFGSKACGLDPLPRDFENMDDEEIAIDLPYEFVSFYGLQEIQDSVAPLQDPCIELDLTLYLKFSLVHELFQPSFDGILSCTTSVLDKLKGDIDTVYLVGGLVAANMFTRRFPRLIKLISVIITFVLLYLKIIL